MLNVTVAAAATGLPSAIFNRRRMLLGLAAASTAAAGPVAIAASRPAAVEAAELLDLGAKTAFVLADYHSAVSERAAIMTAWSPKAPIAPPEILCPSGSGRPRRILERCAPHHWQSNVRTRESFETDIAWWSDAPSFRKGTKPETVAKRLAHRAELVAQAKTNLSTLEQYEADFAMLEKASGIRAAIKAHLAALEILAAHVREVMALEPSTMAGVLIQAEALEALGHAPAFERMAWEGDRLAARGYGERIAASILRIAGNAWNRQPLPS